MATTSRGERYLPVARLPSVRYAGQLARRGSVLAEDVPVLLLYAAVEGSRGPAATAAVAIDIHGASDGERDLGAGQIGDGDAYVIEGRQRDAEPRGPVALRRGQRAGEHRLGRDRLACVHRAREDVATRREHRVVGTYVDVVERRCSALGEESERAVRDRRVVSPRRHVRAVQRDRHGRALQRQR